MSIIHTLFFRDPKGSLGVQVRRLFALTQLLQMEIERMSGEIERVQASVAALAVASKEAADRIMALEAMPVGVDPVMVAALADAIDPMVAALHAAAAPKV